MASIKAKRKPHIIRTAAFQGELGAFSQQAIRQMFGEKVRPVPCHRFDEVFAALKAKKVDSAVLPLENTLAGSIHENYDLMLKHDFEITAETRVRVVHNLIAPPGLSERNIQKVYSHPVALNQCLDFFAAHPKMERVTYYDTAGSVKMMMEQRPENTAAIASELAAKIYKAKILKKGIEDDRQNYTRFVLLEPAGSPPRTMPGSGNLRWKTSLIFSIPNKPGALFRALGTMALRDLSLIKIESRPLRTRPWEYIFHVDLLGHRDDPAVRNALAHLQEGAEFMRVLGSYRHTEGPLPA